MEDHQPLHFNSFFCTAGRTIHGGAGSLSDPQMVLKVLGENEQLEISAWIYPSSRSQTTNS
jgi:hypothetical protein